MLQLGDTGLRSLVIVLFLQMMASSAWYAVATSSVCSLVYHALPGQLYLQTS